MRPLLIRIAINGTITAMILGILGIFFAELAGAWLAGTTRPIPRGQSVRPPEPAQDVALAGDVQANVPIRMALFGFAFIAIGETLLYLWRGNPVEAKPASRQSPPDDAEKLLEELLSQVEAAEKAKQEKPETPSSPS